MKQFKIFLAFFKIGLFTMGGGLAMIPLIQDEFVSKQKWLNEHDVTDVLVAAQALPGVIAVNAATFVGYKLNGIYGSFIATLGVIAPSFIIIFIISLLFNEQIASNVYINKAFTGINAGITALIFVASVKMLKQIVTGKFPAIIAAISFIGILIWQLDITVVVLSSAFISYAYHYFTAIRQVK